VQEFLVEVICDTNFLIHLATKRIKNIDNLDVEIGQVTFVVPQVVHNELSKLVKNPKKQQDMNQTLNFIKNFKVIPLNGNFADKELIDYVKKNRSIISTLDK
jgi:rRNA-processing protein FCF1